MSSSATAAPDIRRHVDWPLTHAIGGRPLAGEGPVLAVHDPSTEALLAELPTVSLEQAREAVSAARRAFDEGPWPRMTPHERSAAMHRLADALQRRRDELVASVIMEAGTPIGLSRFLQVDMAIDFLHWYADAAAVDRTESLPPVWGAMPNQSLVVYHPIGVVSCLTPYNYPLYVGAQKLGAALAAGCTTIVQPSPLVPLTTLLLGDATIEAELPEGVINVIVGDLEVARMLTQAPEVDAVSFTGSVAVGEAVMAQASTGVKRTVLELGGKSANLLLPGTDLQAVAEAVHLRYLRNAGQGCASPTRILVERSRYEEFVEASRPVFESVTVGDPWEEDTVVGPVITAAHRERVKNFVASAGEDGGEVLLGGGRPDLPRGYYVAPTLIGGVDNNARVSQEEIFGPVGVVLSYDNVEEALRIVNGTAFGLSGSVYGPDLQECVSVARQFQSGQVTINGGGANRPDAPFGGFKQSGLGRETGEWGIREFLEPQHINWRLA